MKIGVISDTHIIEKSGEIPMKILEAFKEVDMIIHAGDLVDLTVVEKLKSVCSNVVAVWGNMDPEDVRKGLPQKEILKAGNLKIGVMHGWGHPGNLTEVMQEAFKGDKVDIVIFGHSHSPFNEKIKGVLFFNPGSATDKVFAPYNSYGIIEINGGIKAKVIRI
ncbi:MAG: metallophosphoesterase family protein [Candidatus Omnitrophota bacterium]